jgi:hypothetical protein
MPLKMAYDSKHIGKCAHFFDYNMVSSDGAFGFKVCVSL